MSSQSATEKYQQQQKDYKFLSDIVASEKDLDIRAYTKKIKEELNRLEEECITDFLTINKEVGTLYQELNQSTAILTKIENVVDSFQKELGDISSQVSILQEKSQSYNISLKNRKQLEKTISSYLSSFLIPQDLIDTLCNGEIDNEYLEKVGHLNQILQHSKSQEITDSRAIQEIKPEIDKLKLKVCSRARNFLMSKMNNLKKPKTNFQILQESVLLKYKPLVIFLKDNSQETYVELTNYYAEIMDKIYHQLLKNYLKETQKLVEERVGKHDLIILDENAGAGKHKTTNAGNTMEFIQTMNNQQRFSTVGAGGQENLNSSMMSNRSNLPAYVPTNIFDIEDRLQICNRMDQPALVSHISQQKQRKFVIEEIFRSQNRLLIEAISKEFVFILEFFDLKIAQCSYIFNQIFSRVVNYFIDWIKSYSQNSLYDIYATLLIILINEENKKIMQRNKIPVLDYYFDKINMILWPKFAQIFETYLDNIKRSNPKVFKLYNQPNVHQSTVRYVDFVVGLYRIANIASQDMLIQRLSQIKIGFCDFVIKMATEHFDGTKEQIVFMVNNYDYIYNQLKILNLEKGVQDVIAIEQDLNSFLQKFIKIIMKENYPGLDEVVGKYCISGDNSSSEANEDESSTPQNMPQTLKKIDPNQINLKLLEQVAQDFQMNYRNKTDLIAKEMKQNIQNVKTMQNLFQKFMRMLMLRYSSFVELIKTAHSGFYKEMPSPHLVLLDLKNAAHSIE